MAEKKIQTRIALKIDTLAHWQDIWETFKPMAGEKILFQIPTDTTLNSEGTEITGTTPPQVISKTGDGTTVLKNLPWDSALAADVAAWAKPGSGEDVYVDMPSFVEHVGNIVTNLGNVTARVSDLERKVPRDYATKEELRATVGTPYDTSNADTIYGAKKKAVEEAAAVLGTSADAAGNATVHGALKAAANAATAASQANDNANSRVLTTTYEAGQKAQDDRLAALEGKIGGVTGAMHFKGVVTTDPTTITSGYSNGDVVIYGNKEYVFNNSAFVELGDTTAELQAITNLQTAVNTTIPTTYATKTELTTAINNLDSESSGDGNFITGVSQTNGKVTVTKGSKSIGDLSDGSRVGTLETNLGTAQTNITNLQTAVKAIQDAPYATQGYVGTEITKAIGTLDGKVDGTGDVIVAVAQTDGIVTATKGKLAIANLTDGNRVGAVETVANNAKTAAENAQKEVDALEKLVGTKADGDTIDTAFGRIAKAQKEVDALELVVGDAADTKDDATVYGAIAAEKARAEQAETNLSTTITNLGKKLTTVSTTLNNGLTVTPTTNGDGAKDYKVDIDDSVIFVFDCGSATVNAQNITK